MSSFKRGMKLELLLKISTVKCFYCQSNIKKRTNLTIDHVLPKCHGGKDNINNLVLCCKQCNSKKRDLLLTQFIRAFNIKITKEIDDFL